MGAGDVPPYGKATAKRYDTFVATRRPAGGAIRVVPVGEPAGWVAFFCTDPTATGADTLGSTANRRAWRREPLAERIYAVLRPGLTEVEVRDAADRLLNLAAGY